MAEDLAQVDSGRPLSIKIRFKSLLLGLAAGEAAYSAFHLGDGLQQLRNYKRFKRQSKLVEPKYPISRN